MCYGSETVVDTHSATVANDVTWDQCASSSCHLYFKSNQKSDSINQCTCTWRTIPANFIPIRYTR